MKIAFSQRTWQWNMFIHGAYGCGVETDSAIFSGFFKIPHVVVDRVGEDWGGLKKLLGPTLW